MAGHPDHRGLGRVFPDRLVGYGQVEGALQNEEGRGDGGRPEPLAEVLDPYLDAGRLDRGAARRFAVDRMPKVRLIVDETAHRCLTVSRVPVVGHTPEGSPATEVTNLICQ